MKKITHDLLKSWSPCSEIYKRFCELFPEGALLDEAIQGLVDDGHDGWGFWLFNQCRQKGLFKNVTDKGYRNSGHLNSGDRNSGHWNSGDLNSGHWNSGHLNSGDRNSGYFNTNSPESILVFNKPCDAAIWDAAYKPAFLYFNLTVWIAEDRMTDQEKVDNPKFYVAGGYLKKRDYNEAFRDSWDSADKKDRARIKALPNFDAAIFKEISGIDVEAE